MIEICLARLDYKSYFYLKELTTSRGTSFSQLVLAQIQIKIMVCTTVPVNMPIQIPCNTFLTLDMYLKWFMIQVHSEQKVNTYVVYVHQK